MTRYSKGFPIREWHKTRPRNEALDARVYALAALKILNPNMPRLVERLGESKAKAVASDKANSSQKDGSDEADILVKKPRLYTLKNRRSGGWMSGSR